MKLLALLLLLGVLAASASYIPTKPTQRRLKPLTRPPLGWQAGVICDLASTWVHAYTDIDAYTTTHTSKSNTTYVVHCDQGDCKAWKKADITVNPDGTLAVAYDSGTKHTGYMLADCSAIAWSDGSYWLEHRHEYVQTCDLSGAWFFNGGESYYFVTRTGSNMKDPTPIAKFTARCFKGSCSSWKSASLTLLPRSQVLVHFDSGVQDVGQVSSSCAFLDWADKTTWQHTVTNATVHFVPQSHNDPGWVSSLWEYYNNKVRSIYTQVVESLIANPARTYCGEIASFWKMWWEDEKVDSKLKAAVPGLIAKGQLAMAGAGYASPDEAIVWYGDNLDTSAYGHLWMQKQWGGPIPIIGWQADPFGHSSSQALAWSQMGYNAFMFGRPASNTDQINFQLGQVWHPTKSFPTDQEHSIFFYQHQQQYCHPWIDCAKFIYGFAYNTAAVCMMDWMVKYHIAPFPSNIQLMFGCDFEWTDASFLYPHVDKTIEEFNKLYASAGMHMIYSVPDRFFKALNEEKHVFMPRGDGDTMPHQGTGMPWWTGFYVSRPEFKLAWHQASAFWHAAQNLHTTARMQAAWRDQFNKLVPLWEAVSLVQHHDAITGDSKQYVTEDYGQIVQNGVQSSIKVVNEVIDHLSGASGAQVCYNATSVPCSALQSLLSSGQCAALTVYNSLAWTRSSYVSTRIPVAHVQVTDPQGQAVTTQISPITTRTSHRNDQGEWTYDVEAGAWELVFGAVDLPPLGFKVYQICPSAAPHSRASGIPRNGDFVLQNAHLALSFKDGGFLQNIKNKISGVGIQARASMQYYHAKAGDENAWDFNTDGSTTPSDFPHASGQKVVSLTLDGPLYQEAVISIDAANGVLLAFRVYADDDHVVVRTGAGPFEQALIDNSVDVVLQLQTSIENNVTWYTDSQGLEMKERRLNWRPWAPLHFDPAYPAASNYYPLTTAVRMNDSQTSLVFVTQNTHGAASLTEGELEIMCHRYWHDSADMMTLNSHTEQAFWMVFDTPSATIPAQRIKQHDFPNPVVLLVASSLPVVRVWTPLRAPLPSSVHLLSLQTLSSSFTTLPDGALLLRLAHLYAKGESDQAQPVQVDLSALFSAESGLKVQSAVEYTWNGVQPMQQAQANRWKWLEKSPSSSSSSPVPLAHVAAPSASGNSLVVTLQPLDIKTFVVQLA